MNATGCDWVYARGAYPLMKGRICAGIQTEEFRSGLKVSCAGMAAEEIQLFCEESDGSELGLLGSESCGADGQHWHGVTELSHFDCLSLTMGVTRLTDDEDDADDDVRIDMMTVDSMVETVEEVVVADSFK